MNIKDTLQKIGLTQGETAVYLALLDLGSSTAGPITTKAGVSPSKIYDILGRLTAKGLVSHVIKKTKTKHYRAVEPKRLFEFLQMRRLALEDEEKQLIKVMPLLEARHKLKGKKEIAEIFDGVAGIKTVFEICLAEAKRGDTVYIFSYPLLASKLFHEYNKAWHSRRVKKGLYQKSIFDKETWFFKKREKRKLIEQRYLPEDVISPGFLMLLGDLVCNIVVTESQKLSILIRNKEVAKNYLRYFNVLWKQAIKTGK